MNVNINAIMGNNLNPLYDIASSMAVLYSSGSNNIEDEYGDITFTVNVFNGHHITINVHTCNGNR